MTTNQTIDGVSRELVQRIAKYIDDGLHLSREERDLLDELRALLDAEQPAPVAPAGNRTPFEIEHDAEPGDEAAFRQWRQERLNPSL